MYFQKQLELLKVFPIESFEIKEGDYAGQLIDRQPLLLKDTLKVGEKVYDTQMYAEMNESVITYTEDRPELLKVGSMLDVSGCVISKSYRKEDGSFGIYTRVVINRVNSPKKETEKKFRNQKEGAKVGTDFKKKTPKAEQQKEVEKDLPF